LSVVHIDTRSLLTGIIFTEGQIRKLKKLDVYIEECRKHNMYLGMYNFTNESYCYDWIKDIIKQKTGEIIKKEKIIL
jgi:hypothetical protein